MKRLMLIAMLLSSAASLSGCIIRDHRHDDYRGRYDGSSHHCDDRDNRCDDRWRH